MRCFVLRAAMIVCVVTIAACGRTQPNSTASSTTANAIPAPQDERPWWLPSDMSNAKSVTLRGKVIQMRWAKSGESWEAGGSEYFVLQTIEGKRHILRPSSQITFDQFSNFDGKSVEIAGQLIDPVPWKPENDLDQYPIMTNRRGGGFIVNEIRVITSEGISEPATSAAPESH